MGRGQDAGGLRHEVHATEDDVVGVGTGSGFAGQQEGVALEVGVLDHLFPLVMMAQDGDRAAQLPAGFADPLVQFPGGVMQVFGGNLLPPHVDGHLLRQGLGREFVFGLAKSRVLKLSDRHGRPTACNNH